MANNKATGKKEKKGPELAQRVRAALLNSMDILEKKGRTISQIMAEEFEKNPIKFLELVSKYCPKDVHAEITHHLNANQLTDDELADIATGSSTRTTEQESGQSNIH